MVDDNGMTLRRQDAEGIWHEVEVETASRFDREFAHFIACWRGDDELRVTVHDGLAANRFLEAAYASDAALIAIRAE